VLNNPLAFIDPLGTDCDEEDPEYYEDESCDPEGQGGGDEETPWDPWAGDPWHDIMDPSHGGVLYPWAISGYIGDFYDRLTFGFGYYDLPGKQDEFGRAAYRFESIRLTGYDPALNVRYVELGDMLMMFVGDSPDDKKKQEQQQQQQQQEEARRRSRCQQIHHVAMTMQVTGGMGALACVVPGFGIAPCAISGVIALGGLGIDWVMEGSCE
jgi:hypothetical protein